MLKLIGFALRFYPLIMIGVNVIEAVMSDKTGEQKKAALVSALKTLASRTGIRMDPNRERLISEAIDLIVTVFNVTGAFKKVEPILDMVAEEVIAVPPFVRIPPLSDERMDELEQALLR